LLDVENVSVRFGGVTAVKNVNLALHRGEVLGLIGANGAGKTTLLNVISGLIRPNTGSLVFEGEPIGGCKGHVIARRGIARTFQIVQPFRNLTALQNVVVGAMFCSGGHVGPDEVQSTAREALQLVGIATKSDRLPAQLTLSDRKRLELARALATKPKLLLLDEVMAGLNHSEIESIISLIRDINRTGLTIIVVEHVMKAIMAVCHRILVLQFGEKIAEGAPQEIVNDPRVVGAYLGERFARRHGEKGRVA
jgi:branched-chain amino acid transport system ATP-binding protein